MNDFMSSAGFFLLDSEKHFLLDVSEWNLQFYVETAWEQMILREKNFHSLQISLRQKWKIAWTSYAKKKPGFPLHSGKAASRRLAHIDSLLDYGKFMYGENAMWREIFTDHNKCLYIIQSGVSHN